MICSNLYNNVIIKNDYEEELLDVIHNHKHNVYKTLVDINKIINHVDKIQRGWFKTDYEPVQHDHIKNDFGMFNYIIVK